MAQNDAVDRGKRFEIKRKFFKRAIREHRGADAISKLLAAERRYKANMAAAKADKPLVEIFMKENEGNARSIRAFNLIAEKSGINVRLHDKPQEENQNFSSLTQVYSDTETMASDFRIFAAFLKGQPKKHITDVIINPKGERVYSEVDENCIDLSDLFAGGKNLINNSNYDLSDQTAYREPVLVN